MLEQGAEAPFRPHPHRGAGICRAGICRTGVVSYRIAQTCWKIIGFIVTDENRLEMLFITPNNRGKGTGKLLLQYAINQLGITEVDVNEQNPQAVGFYQYMGFIQYARSEIDGEGNPFPILHMKLNTTK